MKYKVIGFSQAFSSRPVFTLEEAKKIKEQAKQLFPDNEYEIAEVKET